MSDSCGWEGEHCQREDLERELFQVEDDKIRMHKDIRVLERKIRRAKRFLEDALEVLTAETEGASGAAMAPQPAPATPPLAQATRSSRQAGA